MQSEALTEGLAGHGECPGSPWRVNSFPCPLILKLVKGCLAVSAVFTVNVDRQFQHLTLAEARKTWNRVYLWSGLVTDSFPSATPSRLQDTEYHLIIMNSYISASECSLSSNTTLIIINITGARGAIMYCTRFSPRPPAALPQNLLSPTALITMKTLLN